MTELKPIPNPLPDKTHRDLASGNDAEKSMLSKNIFIEAGAGTGKTETIVRRIINQLYQDHQIEMKNVSAITFTEKAAAELRSRFRKLLSKDLNSPGLDSNRTKHLLETLDTASIGTIHSFAMNILASHSVAAGIPVGFRISNENSGAALRTARARRVVDQVRAGLDSKDREEFYDIGFDGDIMQKLVEAMDEKFTRLVGGFKFDTAANTELYQVATIRFISKCYSELQNEMESRRKSGNIEFDDLLVLTLRLLEGDPQVRKLVHETVRILVVDEFQDTDPVQWEIIKLISSDPADHSRKPLPGRLVVVGDPKQAIYAFRGGDINTYIAARTEFPQFGELLQLTSNFRSTKGILDFVNQAFRDEVAPGVKNPMHMGVEYSSLDNIHNPEASEPGTSVLLMKKPDTPSDWISLLQLDDPSDEELEAATSAIKLPELELRSTALAIRKAIDEKWLITEKAPELNYQRVYAREANFGDVCVLVPVRTHLKTLLNEFEAAGVPYRSNDPSIVYNRPLIAGIRDAISVIAKSDDQAKIWGALKSPLFGFSDQQLFDHRQAGGGWYVGKKLNDGAPEVNTALEMLHELSESSKSANPAWLIAELVERQQLFQVLLHDDLGEFEASCLRMAIAHAQQWMSEGNIGLLAYLEWINTMLSESTRATLPQPDDLDFNAVQIMTVHGSKGLEFPITVVTGLASTIKPDRPKLLFSPADSNGDRQIEFNLLKKEKSGNYCSEGYDALYQGESLSASLEEISRLIYVACTRAQDHLILSVFAADSELDAMTQSRGRRLREASLYFDKEIEIFRGHKPSANKSGGQLAGFQKLDPEHLKWLDSFREVSGQPTMRAPSTHEPAGLSPKTTGQFVSKDEGLPDGRPLGRAIHGVMELVMLGAGMPDEATLEKYINQLIEREQIEDQRTEVESRIGNLLRNKEIIEALETQDRWPELHLAKKVDEGSIRFVEGFADLVYKSAQGYVLVDYKTDANLEAAMDHYREQLGAYAEIIQEITGQKTARVLIIHARVDAAETVPLEI